MSIESQQQEASIAVAAMAELARVHKQFLESTSRTNPTPVNGGFFRVEGDLFTAEALGVPFQVSRRPVAVQDRFHCSEYAFTTEIDCIPVQLWQMYLAGNGGLYLDADLTERICDYNNQYVPSHVVGALVGKLLRSSVFAPRTGV